MKIKICGITSKREVTYLNDNKVDYAGFVFYKKSKRNITIEDAKDIKKNLIPNTKAVAVMVSPTKNEFIEKQNAGFDVIQIHEDIKKEILDVAKVPIWLAINFTDEEFREKTSWLNGLDKDKQTKIKGIVVDSKNFGSGETFNWQKNKEKLQNKAFDNKEFILAGGLNKDNVREAISIIRPDIVDVSSGVEISKERIGKDEKLIAEFVKAVRE